MAALPSNAWPTETNPDRPPQGRKLTRAEKGDCSRKRRFSDPIRLAYYAGHRARRFSRRMLGAASPAFIA